MRELIFPILLFLAIGLRIEDLPLPATIVATLVFILAAIWFLHRPKPKPRSPWQDWRVYKRRTLDRSVYDPHPTRDWRQQ